MSKGLGCPQKHSRIRDFLKLYDIDIVLIQETKAAFPSGSFFRSLGGTFLSGWNHLNSIRASGGQFIVGRDSIFECSSELVGEFLLSVRLTHRRFGQNFVITSVYGPCVEGGGADLWREL